MEMEMLKEHFIQQEIHNHQVKINFAKIKTLYLELQPLRYSDF